MGKDKAMDALARNQQKWEKKREKIEKKSQTVRGSVRQHEKEQKKVQKEQGEAAAKEHKVRRIERAIERKIAFARVTVAAAITGLYITAMLLIMRQSKSNAQKDNGTYRLGNTSIEYVQTDDLDGPFSLCTPLPATLTTLMLVALTATFLCEGTWKEKFIKQEEQYEAAKLIKDQLERKKMEKENEERMAEQRLLQQKEAMARLQRLEEKEAAALQRAKESARALRRCREQHQAAQAPATACGGLQDSGECDEHGWTAKQRRQLREAVGQYPEGWSHARGQRWDMIALAVGGGKSARACESTFARLEAEAREAAASAKQKQEGTGQIPVVSMTADLDWMTGDFDWDCTTVDEGPEDEEDEEEEEEEEPERARMAVETEPAHKGTEIRLEGIKAMHGCFSIQVELLHLQLSCADCRVSTSLCLSGADEDAADAKTWCEGCTSLISARLRPTLVHCSGSRLCYVDCVGCVVTDVLPSVLMSVCENCNADNVHKQEFMRNRIIEGSCFRCYAKYAFCAEAIRIEQVTPCARGGGGSRQQAKSGKDDGGDPMDEIAEELRYLRKRAKADPREQLIQLGKPLPQMGACRHFKKSYKWYRFACCGRAFPCPECHVESGCPAAPLGAHASRMICGKCSMEQGYAAARPCEKCGFIMMARGSSHWDGGDGTRSFVAMSTKDSKKFKGGLKQANSKTKTSSKKADRVGAKAKARHEQERKFGRNV